MLCIYHGLQRQESTIHGSKVHGNTTSRIIMVIPLTMVLLCHGTYHNNSTTVLLYQHYNGTIAIEPWSYNSNSTVVLLQYQYHGTFTIVEPYRSTMVLLYGSTIALLKR